MVMQHFARFWTNLGNLRISQDICYVRMTDDNDFLTIYGHRTNLLNNNNGYKHSLVSITVANNEDLFILMLESLV